jgi:hypothetical protein
MISTSGNVSVLCWGAPSHSDDNARKMAEFVGAKTAMVPVAGARDIKSVSKLVPSCTCLIASAETLARLAQSLDTGADGLLALLDRAAHVFVYGFEPAGLPFPGLQTLSSGGLLGVGQPPTDDFIFRVAENHRELLGPFSGLSVRGADPARDAHFIEGPPGGDLSVLIRRNGQPFLVRAGHGHADVFLVACRALGDVDEKVDCEAGLLPWFSRIVPLMVFLRHSLGNQIWHSDVSQSCFIIDDPLLKRKYGFLEYSKLVATMRRRKFSTSIAFIPWNYRRSHRQVASLFSIKPSFLSLCVHGCDHTSAEFAAPGFPVLRDKARTALHRMQKHSALSGVPFDDVMVFPQGLFSSKALSALDACGYLAAVNTQPCPTDAPHAITLKDLLDVAVTRFGGFPLFGRHYPRDAAEFAFDLFLGKPALLVEHHHYFRNGYSELETFIQRLNDLDEQLEWRSLADICSRACLRRIASDGQTHLRFYTNRFQFTNGGRHLMTYVLERRWSVDRPLPAVTFNGNDWLREQKGDCLRITLSLEPGQGADIRLVAETIAPAIVQRRMAINRYNAKVLVRRMLSEFRDDHVDTNPFLAGLLLRARKLQVRR